MKILFRSYITPHKLKKMNSNVSNMCWHGCGATGALIHLLWHCPEVQTFWFKVRDYLCTLFETNFQLCPAVCLLENKIEEATSRDLQHLIDLAFLLVKRTILVNWKIRKPNCFDIDARLNNYLELVSMEQAASVLQDLGSDHMETLSQIMSLVKKSQTDVAAH